MKIQLVTLIDRTLSLDEEKLFINDLSGAEFHFDYLLGVLGYQGDTGDEGSVQEFMRNLEGQRAVIYDFSIPTPLSGETLEMLNRLEEWARMYRVPDFLQVSMALAELKAFL